MDSFRPPYHCFPLYRRSVSSSRQIYCCTDGDAGTHEAPSSLSEPRPRPSVPFYSKISHSYQIGSRSLQWPLIDWTSTMSFLKLPVELRLKIQICFRRANASPHSRSRLHETYRESRAAVLELQRSQFRGQFDASPLQIANYFVNHLRE